MCIRLILYYCVLCVLIYIYNEAQQNLRARFGSRKTGLSPSILILTVPRWYFCCGSLLLLVLAVRINTLVHLLLERHVLVKFR